MQDDKQRGGLAEKFADFSAAPSVGLWNAITESLDDNKKRRGFVWWWIGSGLAAVLLVGIMVYNLPGTTNQSTIGNAEVNDRSEFNQDKPESLEKMVVEDDLSEDENSTINLKLKPNKSTYKQTEKRNQIIQKNGSSSGQGGNLLANQPSVFSSNPSSKTEPTVPEITGFLKRNLVRMQPSFLGHLPTAPIATNLIALTIPSVANSKWEIGVDVTPLMKGGSQLKSSQNPSDNPGNLSTDTASLDIAESFEGVTGKFTRVEKPIGFSFKLAYRLQPNFWLTTGLRVENTRYSTNQSAETYFMANTANNAKIIVSGNVDVLSVGIPVGVAFDFLKWKRFSAGFGADILNEFPILERYHKLESLSNTTKATNHFTWGYNLGVDANLQLSYKLTNRLKIQASPGLRWYALLDDDYSTVNLPQRKVWFGGSFGLMWRLN